jgi:hypothetical protein
MGEVAHPAFKETHSNRGHSVAEQQQGKGIAGAGIKALNEA